MITRAPASLTARALSTGTVVAATCLAVGFVSTLVGATGVAATTLLAVGIVVLIATPALGLAATFIEARESELRTALLALVVLAILAVAAILAVMTH